MLQLCAPLTLLLMHSTLCRHGLALTPVSCLVQADYDMLVKAEQQLQVLVEAPSWLPRAGPAAA